MDSERAKQPRRRGRVISAQLPHLLIAQLDALAADNGWDRTEALKLAIGNLLMLRGTVHVHVSTTPTPREAADVLAGRGRVRIPLRIAGRMGAEQAAGDNAGDPADGKAGNYTEAV